MYMIAALAKPDREARIPHRFSCIVNNHGPTLVLEGDHHNFFSKGLQSGVTKLSIPTDLVSVGDFKVNLDEPLSSEIVISNHEEHTTARRRLREGRTSVPKDEYKGSFTMLVVRVSDKSGHSPTYSAEELSNHVFNDELNMVSYILWYSGVICCDDAATNLSDPLLH